MLVAATGSFSGVFAVSLCPAFSEGRQPTLVVSLPVTSAVQTLSRVLTAPTWEVKAPKVKLAAGSPLGLGFELGGH